MTLIKHLRSDGYEDRREDYRLTFLLVGDLHLQKVYTSEGGREGGGREGGRREGGEGRREGSEGGRGGRGREERKEGGREGEREGGSDGGMTVIHILI